MRVWDDRLVASGLLSRRDDPADRRNLVLELTADGRQLVNGVNRDRRLAITAVLAAMPSSSRDMLAAALTDFAEAGGEIAREHSDDASPRLGAQDPARGRRNVRR